MKPLALMTGVVFCIAAAAPPFQLSETLALGIAALAMFIVATKGDKKP